MSKLPKEQAIAKVARYCSTRERAPHQVKEKLIKWGIHSTQADEIIDKLKADNFLNEQRFANAYCHDKFEFNKWGKIKIRYGIQKFFLPEEVVDEGLSNIADDRYQDVVAEQAQKKWSMLQNEEDLFIKKQKTANFLIRKGFESSVIYPVVDKLS
ncbi:MAG: regulatory protein RecX [Bacteroidota bacterium]